MYTENSLRGGGKISINSRLFHLITKFCQFVLDLGFLALSDDFKRLGNSL